jgi:FkbM family methyltransferase
MGALAQELLSRLHAANPYAGFPYKDYLLDLQGTDQEALFRQLFTTLRPRVIVEVGTWKGDSAIQMAKVLAELQADAAVICVDTWLGSLEHLDGSIPGWQIGPYVKHGYPCLYQQFLANVLHSGCQDRLIPLPNTSDTAALWLLHHQVVADLVYIDANHEEEQVYRDLCHYWEILRPGGIMCGNDWDVYWHGVMGAVNRFAGERELNLEVKGRKWLLTKSDVAPSSPGPAPQASHAVRLTATNRNLLSASDGSNGCVLGRDGYIVYNRNDIYGGQGIERYGEDAELECQILRQMCRPGDVVVEVGANIGTRTMAFARRVGPSGFVYAYEPQRIVFQTLCANLAVNSLVNVDARCAAVGTEQRWVEMPNMNYSKPGNFGGVAVCPLGTGRRVPQVRLDDDLEISQLDLMKIDVEGMEREVLVGADVLIRRFTPAIYIENDRPEKSDALICHLMELGYRLYWHKPLLFNSANFFGEAVNIFPNIVSVNMVCVHHSHGQQVEGLVEITGGTGQPV